MIEIDKQFENNLNKIKELSALLKKNEKKNTRVPLLVFNSITDEKPEINISAILQQKDYEKAAYFGDLVGEFKNHEQKHEFFNIVLEIVHGNTEHEMFKHFKKLDDFSLEVYILDDFLKRNNILKLDSLKIYKFDSPDFIIELSNGEIIGTEIICANPNSSPWFSKNILKIERVFKKQKENNQPRRYPPDDWDDADHSDKSSYYHGITKDNIDIIRKHFKKQKQYNQNIQKLYSDKSIKILYCIPLGDGSRLTVNEEKRLKEIKNNAIEFDIDFKNVFVLISHNKELKWWNLEKIVTDLNL
ncbi:MAG: hypothetical protein ACRC8P_00290 [Spiroplasma sp.]